MGDRASSGESERRKGKDDDDASKAKVEKTDAKEKVGNGRASGTLPPVPDSAPAVDESPRKAKAGSIPPPRPSRPPPPPPPPTVSAAPAASPAEEPRHPSIPPLPAAGPWRSYKEIVAGLAQRIVDGQK